MSHDVDWRRQGPPTDHILERKERFDRIVLEKAKTINPYYNIPEFMEIEDKFGFKSDIRELINGGWEVGLHLDPSSIQHIDKIRDEKAKLESLTRNTIVGNRVHYLIVDDRLPSFLQKLGFKYDSSIAKSKNNLDKVGYGYYRLAKLIEFPITLMDAYMFTYMGVTENQIIKVFDRVLNNARKLGPKGNILTIIWHENVLKMKGGRMYTDIINFLSSQDDITLVRGMDLIGVVENINIC